MKTKIIFLLMTILFSTNVFAQTQSAAAFVRSFYKFHRARSGIFNATEVNAHKNWFSAELNRLFQNELKREKEYLKKYPTNKPYFGDGFPFTPYEECYMNGREIKNDLKIGTISINRNKALVEVKFYYPKACGGDLSAEYQMELIKNNGGWMINDMIWSDKKRLTEDLNRAEY